MLKAESFFIALFYLDLIKDRKYFIQLASNSITERLD